jgi:hypothetical protein
MAPGEGAFLPTAQAAAPSTTLRVVPLPRFTEEEPDCRRR